jgi:hypothetical protein
VASNLNWDKVSESLAIATCAGLSACVLAIPVYGFLPLALALGSLVSVSAVAKVLRGG